MFGRALLAGLCVLAALSPDGVWPNAAPPAARVAQAQPAAQAMPIVQPAKSAADPVPVRLMIPKIGVNATIEARGLDANRTMLTPRDYRDVAWYNLGPMPGRPGNALLNGHVNWWTGSAVFTRLSELRTGDIVFVVRGDGNRLRFKVTGRSVVTAGARIASLFAPSRVATLTLITCTGSWDPSTLSDTHRLLVSAVLV